MILALAVAEIVTLVVLALAWRALRALHRSLANIEYAMFTAMQMQPPAPSSAEPRPQSYVPSFFQPPDTAPGAVHLSEFLDGIEMETADEREAYIRQMREEAEDEGDGEG